MLCQEEELGEYVIVYLNDNEHPVHALAVAEAIRIPRNIAQQQPPCFFTSPGPALELEIVTDPEEFEATIGSDPVAMPEPVFEVTSSRAEGGLTYHWALELSYEEGNYGTFADTRVRIPEEGYVEIQGDTSWSPDFGDEILGGEIEVTVTASLGPFADTAVREGYEIKGENPGVAEIYDWFPDNGGRAMVATESDLQGQPEQFSGCEFIPGQGWDCTGSDPNEPNFPLRAPDNGWGLTQLTFCVSAPETCIPTQESVWNWEENLRIGENEFYTHGPNAWDRVVEEFLNNGGLNWGWDPTNEEDTYPFYDDEPQELHESMEGREVEKIIWLTYYARYNAGTSNFGNNEANHLFDYDDGSINTAACPDAL